MSHENCFIHETISCYTQIYCIELLFKPKKIEIFIYALFYVNCVNGLNIWKMKKKRFRFSKNFTHLIILYPYYESQLIY